MDSIDSADRRASSASLQRVSVTGSPVVALPSKRPPASDKLRQRLAVVVADHQAGLCS